MMKDMLRSGGEKMRKIGWRKPREDEEEEEEEEAPMDRNEPSKSSSSSSSPSDEYVEAGVTNTGRMFDGVGDDVAACIDWLTPVTTCECVPH